jgi:hypothetical protein
MTTSSPSISVSAAGELPPHSTDVAEEMSRILLASETVGTSSEQHNLADRYLVSFQKQPIAWIVCEKISQCQQFYAPMLLLHHHRH